MHFFYFNSRIGKYIFFIAAIIIVGGSLWISNNLVRKLEQEERNKMEIWAAATSSLASSDLDSDLDLILTIIKSNTTIPVIVADENDQIVQYSNVVINKNDTAAFLAHKLAILKDNGSRIDIDLGDGDTQYLYYEDSILLKQLSYFPYIQLLVLIIFALIAYVGLMSVKRAEQNKVWVGLSKETAHQLGTPIS